MLPKHPAFWTALFITAVGWSGWQVAQVLWYQAVLTTHYWKIDGRMGYTGNAVIILTIECIVVPLLTVGYCAYVSDFGHPHMELYGWVKKKMEVTP